MKKRAIALCMVLAACLIAGGLLLYQEWAARQPPKILLSGTKEPITALKQPEQNGAISTEPETTINETEESAAPGPADYDREYTPASNGFGTVTIKGKTFPVKRGVSEKALNGNIGWMESSAMPGEDGMCILMGHRNQQFRILKDVQSEDIIMFTYPDGSVYAYTVQSAKIIESDRALRFEAEEGKTLLLVTCYPFYFRGHAPQKFMMLSRTQDNW